MKVFYPKLQGLVGDTSNGSHTFGSDWPCYCSEQPDGSWRVVQISGDGVQHEAIVANAPIMNMLPATSALVLQDVLNVRKQGGPPNYISIIESGKTLVSVKHPDGYLEGAEVVEFSCDKESYTCPSPEFFRSTTPLRD